MPKKGMRKNMKIIKRDGRAVDYNREKIQIAIEKANREVREKERATKEDIKEIITYIEEFGKKRMLVEDISRQQRPLMPPTSSSTTTSSTIPI